jgi:hypothetical protein
MTTYAFPYANPNKGKATLNALGHVIQPSAITRDVFNPCDDKYGCVGDGATNDYAGMLQCHLDLWAAGGGRIIFPSGKRFLLSPAVATTPFLLPPNNDDNKQYVFEWEGDSEVVLTANFPHLYTFGRTADNQWWRNFIFINPGVDGGNVGAGAGGEDIFLGPDVNGGMGANSQRINVNNFVIESPRFRNVPAGGVGAPRRWINFLSRHVFTNEGDAQWNPNAKVQTSLTDITLRGHIRIDGGDMGFCVSGGVQRGSTSGMRIKNFAGNPAVINYMGLTNTPPPINDWIAIGSGDYCERHRIVAIADNGDGTGSLTIEGPLTYVQPSDDITGAGLGAPMCSGNMANVWINGIHVEGSGYILPGAGAYGSTIQIGGGGIGGYDISINANGITMGYTNDNTIEIDTVLGSTINVGRLVDAGNEVILHRNFNFPQDKNNNLMPPYMQKHTVKNTVVDIFSVNPTDAQPGAAFLPGYAWTPGNNTPGAAPTFGHVHFDNCIVVDRATNFRMTKGSALWCGNESAIQKITGDITYIKLQVNEATAAAAPRVFNISPTSNCRVQLKMTCILLGSMVGTAVPEPLNIEPASQSGAPVISTMNTEGSILEIESRLTGVGVGGTRIIRFAAHNTLSAKKGNLKGGIALRILGWAGSDTNPKPFDWNAGSVLTILNNYSVDCDLTALPNSIINTFGNYVANGYTRQIRFTRTSKLFGTISNLAGVGFNQFIGSGKGFIPYDPAPAGAAWAFTNDLPFDVRLQINGWTVTSIDFTADGTASYQNGSIPVNETTFILRPGDGVRINNTAVGTARVTPIGN